MKWRKLNVTWVRLAFKIGEQTRECNNIEEIRKSSYSENLLGNFMKSFGKFSWKLFRIFFAGNFCWSWLPENQTEIEQDYLNITLVAFCSVATAFADKFVRFRLFRNPNWLILTLSDLSLCLRVSRSIFSGVCVPLSQVDPFVRPDTVNNERLPLLLLLLLLYVINGWDVLVLMFGDL